MGKISVVGQQFISDEIYGRSSKTVDVSFMIIEKVEDIQDFDQWVRVSIPGDRWLIMLNYENISKLWPQHLKTET